MINNNVKKFFQVGTSGGSVYGVNINGVQTSYTLNENYVFMALCARNAANPGAALSLPYGGACVVVGFGDTAEAPDDYGLADGNYNNARLAVANYGKNTFVPGDIISIYAGYTNNTGSNVIVKELGIIGNPTGNSQASGGNNVCLLFRKVLETPVTIAPGETYIFSYRVKLKE